MLLSPSNEKYQHNFLNIFLLYFLNKKRTIDASQILTFQKNLLILAPPTLDDIIPSKFIFSFHLKSQAWVKCASQIQKQHQPPLRRQNLIERPPRATVSTSSTGGNYKTSPDRSPPPDPKSSESQEAPRRSSGPIGAGPGGVAAQNAGPGSSLTSGRAPYTL